MLSKESLEGRAMYLLQINFPLKVAGRLRKRVLIVTSRFGNNQKAYISLK